MAKQKTTNLSQIMKIPLWLSQQNLAPNLPVIDSNHHYAHALSALFFTDWDNTLVFTADGGGDHCYYSAHHFNNNHLITLEGGDETISNPPKTAHSMGLFYATITDSLGYRRHRHEGKITGLAALGKPTLYDDLKKFYRIDNNNRIVCAFSSYQQMQKAVSDLTKQIKPADVAASAQKILEDIIVSCINGYLCKTRANTLALAGGVFANVSLNRKLSELSNIDEIFIFPGMGDEGLAVGGVYDFLLKRDGIDLWKKNRQRLSDVYWGGNFDYQAKQLFEQHATRINENTHPTDCAAQLIAEGEIVALYQGRMEFGPRALGARSILASPIDANINQSLNNRLTRSEFMPFAPVVLATDANEVFELPVSSRYASNFMTITCVVKPHWQSKIPAVVHVDGTARPQIIDERRHPIYASVLKKFKAITGLPVMINTSFNAHEEPIIYKPQECLNALNNNRVDYVLLAAGVYKKKST